MAQESSDVYDYFSAKIDEAAAAAASVDGDDTGDANPVYAKLFATPQAKRFY